jgi:hypothetical protein
MIVYATHAGLTSGAPTPSTSTSVIAQQGYYAAGDGGWAEYDWNATSTATADGVFIILPSGQSPGTAGRYMLRIPAEGIHPEAAGAYCNQGFGAITGNDDTAAFNALISYVAARGGGTIVQTQKSTGCYIGSGNLVVAGAKLTGAVSVQNYHDTRTPFIFMSPSYTLLMNGRAAHVSNFTVWRAGLASGPTTEEQVATYQNTTITDSSVGVTVNGGNDDGIDNLKIVGFNKCLYATNNNRFYLDRLDVDCANGVELIGLYDGTLVQNIHGNGSWSSDWGSHLNLYGAAVPSGGGGSGYLGTDVLTVPGGACATQPTLTPTVSGGVVTAYTPLDTGDCTVSPQTWGATSSSSVYAGGSGGTNGTGVALTVSGGTCSTQPVLLGTISGGALTAITGVQAPGACPFNTQPPPVATVTGGGLSGAEVNLVTAKNALALTGGSGSGATATISTQGSNYRPGIGLYDHNETDGVQVQYAEFENYQTQCKIADVYDVTAFYCGGEGDHLSPDHQQIGLDLEGCVKDTLIYDPKSDNDYIDWKLYNHPNSSSACGYGTTTDPVIYSGHLAFNAGDTSAGILTGPGSLGTIIAPEIYSTSLGTEIQIGANSGQWAINSIQWANGTVPSPFGAWISVAPSAAPPSSDQYGPTGQGSLLINGDFQIDQFNEYGSASNGTALRADRWRMTAGVSGAGISSVDGSPGPVPYSRMLTFTVNTAATPGSTNTDNISQNIESPDIVALGWGTSNAQPVVSSFWAKASIAGTYDEVFTSGGHSASYVFPFTITAANTWQFFSTVIPGPTIGTWNATAGAVGIEDSFDLGTGATYQTSSTNTWLSGYYQESTGATQLVANSGATLSIAAVHLTAGPFAPSNYQPRLLAAEYGLARRYFQKSLSAGTAVGQNKGAAGAATTLTPFTSGSAQMPISLSVAMAAAPTVTLYNTSAADANCYDATKAADVGAGSAVNVGTGGFTVSCSLSSGSPASGDQIQVQWSADSGL